MQGANYEIIRHTVLAFKLINKWKRQEHNVVRAAESQREGT